jgi:tetratricopeptide (TPR) repeat protein
MRTAFRSLLLLVLAAPLGAQAGRAAYDEGRRLMAADDAAGAERQFERAIRAEPNVALYHLWLGNAVGQQAGEASVVRQPFMARRIKAEFERAVALDPDLLDARDGLIRFYLQAPGVMGGSVEKAREQQREIAKRDAVRGHQAMANIAWHGRDTVATERALRAAVDAVPDSGAVLLTLALRQANWGRIEAAFATLEGFLARHPNHYGVRYQYGRLAGTTGENLMQGERHLRALLADAEWVPGGSAPSRAGAHARLGDILRRQGKRDEARAQYQQALALDANLQIAKEGLRALE